MKTFELHWEDGRTEILKGYDIHNALDRAGYGVLSIYRLSSWKEVKQ